MTFDPATFRPTHFLWTFEDGVATVTLNRPERKNPLTFERYDELRETFHELKGKRDAATLTPDEHAELIALSDTVEAWNVRRLEFVAELARLREVPFPKLVRQLGLVPAADA